MMCARVKTKHMNIRAISSARYHRELEPGFVTPLDREDIFVDWLENGGDYLNRTAVAKLFEPGSDLFEQVERNL